MTYRFRALVSAAAALVFLPLLLSPATAQVRQAEQPAPSASVLQLDLIVGYAGFIDEEMIDHAVLGGAVSALITPRLGVGVEVLHLRGPGEDRDWCVMPILSWDLASGGRFIPYLVGGAGWLHTTTAVGTGLYSFSSWTGGAGGGLRVALAPTVSLAFEGRIGSEPVTRVTAALGWRFGSR